MSSEAGGTASPSLLKRVQKKAQEEARTVVRHTTPVIRRSVVVTAHAGRRAAGSVLTRLDDATLGDQEKVLGAYRSFLSGQSAMVDGRIYTRKEGMRRSPPPMKRPAPDLPTPAAAST